MLPRMEMSQDSKKSGGAPILDVGVPEPPVATPCLHGGSLLPGAGQHLTPATVVPALSQEGIGRGTVTENNKDLEPPDSESFLVRSGMEKNKEKPKDHEIEDDNIDMFDNDNGTHKSDNDNKMDDELFRRMSELVESEEERKARELEERERMDLARKELEKREMDECVEILKSIKMYGNEYVPKCPKYLLLKSGGGRNFVKENVLKKTAWMIGALGVRSRNELPKMKDIKVGKEECVSLVARDDEQAMKLLGLESVGPCRVKIEKDERKNCVVMRFFDYMDQLRGMTDEDVLVMLESQGVIKVENQTRGKNGPRTKLYKLTFDGLEDPVEIRINNYINVRVSPWIQRPMMCFRCFEYNHGSRTCRKKEQRCQRCGVEGHHREECSSVPKCFHCGLGHEAGNKECKIEKAEYEVNRLVREMRMDRRLARAQVGLKVSRPSDAQVVVANMNVSSTGSSIGNGSRVVSSQEKDRVDALCKNFDNFVEGLEKKLKVPQEEENKEDKVDALAKRFEEFAERIDRSLKVPQEEETLDDRIAKEVAKAMEGMVKRMDDMREEMKGLAEENRVLRENAESLNSKLVEAKDENEKLRREVKELKRKAKEGGSDRVEENKDNSDSQKERDSRRRKERQEDKQRSRSEMRRGGSQTGPVKETSGTGRKK